MTTFSTLKTAVTRRFNELIDGGNLLFIAAVSKDALWDTYLNAFPEGANMIYKTRREYDCSTCRHFIKNLGGLISVSPSGEITSLWSGLGLLWPFNAVAADMAYLLRNAAIDRPFLTTETQYGVDKTRTLVTPTTDSKATPSEILTFDHFVAKVPSTFVRTSAQIGPERSERRASHDVLLRALKEIPLNVIDEVLDLIRQGSIYRGDEKLHDLAAFRAVRAEFAALETDLAARYRHGEWGVDIARAAEYAERQRDNFAWVRSTTLPGSVSRIRNTSLGTLLVDLAEGTKLDAAVGKYEAIMALANCKRPTALVTPKMVAKAREVLEALGLLGT